MSFSFVNLAPGDPAPWFRAPCTSNPDFAFDTVGGRYIVLCFLGSAADAGARAALQCVADNRRLFDDSRVSFFGVTADLTDRTEGRVKESLPGIRFFFDVGGVVSRLYGAIPRETEGVTEVPVRRLWIVLDPTLRIMRMIPFAQDGTEAAELMAYLAALPPVDLFAGVNLQAPVLFLPNVFEPAFCRKLIDLYEAHGGEESGFMREVDGKTVGITDPNHKRRRDYTIEDQEIINATQARIKRRIVPEIAKVHQFQVTRMERYIVGCYTAEDGGHFRAHRDNTTKGTAHRRFAISINLNADFEGGEVSFPEYGPRSFKPPPGGAVVFSCSLLHAVSKVTRGRRYAFLPFVYDDAAAKLREQNNPFLAESVGEYRQA
ncbi:MAG: 2OG-Fe(II) oxygenase [Beijerinckiaceae bacterium]|jgi:predicted 2-oxoglutarate/Fe(II)-dependent dioxygenase YbiX/peroxiredoxin|nr:2OG-Fe(II) oxygenase [Beijerinckiaceae bacterium]